MKFQDITANYMSMKLKKFINDIRDLRKDPVKVDNLEDRDVYYIREGFRLGLAATATMLADELDAIIEETDGENYAENESVWWQGIDGSESNPGPDERIEITEDIVDEKDINKSRNGWYGIRVGDLVMYTSLTGKTDELYEVVGYMRTDNNGVILRSEDGRVDKYVAEWCTIVERVEDRRTEALAWAQA